MPDLELTTQAKGGENMCNQEKEKMALARHRICTEIEHLLDIAIKNQKREAQSEELPGLKEALAIVREYKGGPGFVRAS